jgi:hypothetical protein
MQHGVACEAGRLVPRGGICVPWQRGSVAATVQWHFMLLQSDLVAHCSDMVATVQLHTVVMWCHNMVIHCDDMALPQFVSSGLW